MQQILKMDYETRGVVEIGGSTGVGLYNYANHSLTSALFLGYKLPEAKEVDLWRILQGESIPEKLLAAFHDPNVLIESFNSAFERYITQYKIGITLPPERFIDPQIGARSLALPADLDSVCRILDVPKWLAKDDRGEDLIKLFSVPHKKKKKKGEEAEIYFNDWNSHPAEWTEFEEYCKRDVLAEEEVYRREEMLGVMPQSDFERKLWIFDQKVNDRGMPVDLDFVQKAYKLAKRAKEEALKSQNELTGLENANSTQQLLPWAKQRGYPYNTLNKAFVEAALNDPTYEMNDLCRQVLKARLTAGSNSYTKLAKILQHICPDGTIKNQFIFMGSSRCGRWGGASVQPHNLPRPSPPKTVNGHDFEEVEVLAEARQHIYREDYEGIKSKYGNVLEVVKSTLRTVFVAPGSIQCAG